MFSDDDVMVANELSGVCCVHYETEGDNVHSGVTRNSQTNIQVELSFPFPWSFSPSAPSLPLPLSLHSRSHLPSLPTPSRYSIHSPASHPTYAQPFPFPPFPRGVLYLPRGPGHNLATKRIFVQFTARNLFKFHPRAQDAHTT